jgi:hypothetical protein
LRLKLIAISGPAVEDKSGIVPSAVTCKDGVIRTCAEFASQEPCSCYPTLSFFSKNNHFARAEISLVVKRRTPSRGETQVKPAAPTQIAAIANKSLEIQVSGIEYPAGILCESFTGPHGF